MILTTVVLGILGLMMQYFNVNRFLDFFHLLIAQIIFQFMVCGMILAQES